MPDTSATAPVVSVVMACRDVAAYIDAAILSARCQTLRDIDIIVVDDGSQDATGALAARHADADPRVRVIAGRGEGPGAARNLAIAHARGRWIAVLDGDDTMHPERLAILVHQAEASACRIIADNLIAFHDDAARAPTLFVADADWTRPRDIDLATYLVCNKMFSKEPALGYLKPLIHRSLLDHDAQAYDETLRIGEDSDLIARLLVQGHRFRFVPTPYYFYRRRSHSTSHRLRTADLVALIAAGQRLHAQIDPRETAAVRASNLRLTNLRVILSFQKTVDALKRRAVFAAARHLVAEPRAGLLLARAAREHFASRKLASHDTRSDDRRASLHVCTSAATAGIAGGGRTFLAPSLAEFRSGEARGFEGLAAQAHVASSVVIASPDLAFVKPYLAPGQGPGAWEIAC